ncbi:MAG: hypothetical protein MPJ78_02215 [Hyphomicrobiaceae bacterium]|nr:hypothetical protein [Hyphomicrobiaceae bacterium]
MGHAITIFVGVLAVASLATTVFAQEHRPGEPPEHINGEPFRKFVNGHGYFDQLAEEVMQYEARIGACATPEKVERLNAGRPQIPTRFARLGIPPQWMEVLKVTGCGKPVERAVLVLYIEKKLLFLPLVAGNALSRFDVVLQRDVVKTLIPVERVLAIRSGCSGKDSIRILDTHTLSKVSIKGGLAWEEEWRLTNCKGAKSVRVSYSSRKDGETTFQIKQVGPE